MADDGREIIPGLCSRETELRRPEHHAVLNRWGYESFCLGIIDDQVEQLVV